jgi:hypothetical protein
MVRRVGNGKTVEGHMCNVVVLNQLQIVHQLMFQAIFTALAQKVILVMQCEPFYSTRILEALNWYWKRNAFHSVSLLEIQRYVQ